MQKDRFFTPLTVEEVLQRLRDSESQVACIKQLNEEYDRKYHPEKFVDAQPTLSFPSMINK